MARHMLLLALLLLVLACCRADDSATERIRAEIDASGTAKSEDMAAREAEAMAGMAKEMSDALVDIMAVLVHGSDSAKDSAIDRLTHMAGSSAEAGQDQARMFRSAVVAGGAIPELVAALSSTEERRQFLAAGALAVLALDDPTTDADNFHSEEICQNGAVAPLVRLLASPQEGIQAHATQALSLLAENPTCQSMIAAAGAIEPLMKMTTYSSDFQKLGAMGALDVLALNNPAVRDQLQALDAGSVLKGVQTMGSSLLRGQAGEFGERLQQAPSQRPSDEAHIEGARKIRMKYDGVRRQAMKMMRGWDDQPGRGRGRGRG